MGDPRAGFHGENLVEGQPAHRRAANLQKAAAREPIAKSRPFVWPPENGQHGSLPTATDFGPFSTSEPTDMSAGCQFFLGPSVTPSTPEHRRAPSPPFSHTPRRQECRKHPPRPPPP